MNGRYRGQQHFGQGKPCTCTSLVSIGASLSSSLAKLQPAYTDLKVLQYGEILVWFEASSTDVFPANVLRSKHGKTSRKRAWHGVHNLCGSDIMQLWQWNSPGMNEPLRFARWCFASFSLRGELNAESCGFLGGCCLETMIVCPPPSQTSQERDLLIFKVKVTGFRQNRSHSRDSRGQLSVASQPPWHGYQ